MQFVDVAPTLGVNHVIFGVVVLLCVSVSVVSCIKLKIYVNIRSL